MIFGVFFIASTPAISADLSEVQQSPSEKAAPEKMIEDGVKMILSAIQLILKSIPEYKAPEVLDNGDIIIRRVQPNEKSYDEEDGRKKGI